MNPIATPLGQVYAYEDADAVAHAAAEWFAQVVSGVLADRSVVRVALAGGTTPLATYRLLASPGYRDRIDWPRVEIFFGDERCVPPDHPDSNYRNCRQALLDHVPLTCDHVHRIPGEKPAVDAAQAYRTTLRERAGDPPRLDVLFLGMGADGHTASLFSQSELQDSEEWVLPVYRQAEDRWRVSLSATLLSSAAHAAVLVVGKEKAGALAEVLAGGNRFPIQHVHAIDQRWLVDRAALPDR